MSYTLNGFIELSAACHISRLDEYKWNEKRRAGDKWKIRYEFRKK
jgi:hypothetical protein